MAPATRIRIIFLLIFVLLLPTSCSQQESGTTRNNSLAESTSPAQSEKYQILRDEGAPGDEEVIDADIPEISDPVPIDVELSQIDTLISPDIDSLYNEVRSASGTSPEEIYYFVRDEIRNECYEKSLRGGWGTLCAGTGNSIDKSQLLSDLLKMAGYTTRYAHGILINGQIDTYITSMFNHQPETTHDWSGLINDIEGLAGNDEEMGPYLEELIETKSDPVRDPKLRETVSDHWWVEYQTESGWTPLDPAFPETEPGISHCEPIEVMTSIPDELKRTCDLSIIASYADGSSVTAASYSSYVESLTSNPLFIRYVQNENPAEEGISLVINDGVIEGSSIRSRIGQASIESINLEVTIEISSVSKLEGSPILWESHEDLLPGELNSATVVIDTGGCGPLVTLALKDKYDEIDPVHAAMPSSGIIGNLMQEGQHMREQRSSTTDRIRMRAISDGITAYTYSTILMDNLRADSESLGAICCFSAPLVSVVTREETQTDQYISLQSIGISPQYIPAAGNPSFIETGLAQSEPFIEDAIKTMVLEEVTGSAIVSYTNLARLAKENEIPVVTYTDSNATDVNETQLSDPVKERILSEADNGAIVIAITSPVEMNGTSYEAVAVAHSPFEFEIYGPDGVLMSLSKVSYAAGVSLQGVIIGGIMTYSIMEIDEVLSNCIGSGDHSDERIFHDVFSLYVSSSSVYSGLTMLARNEYSNSIISEFLAGELVIHALGVWFFGAGYLHM